MTVPIAAVSAARQEVPRLTDDYTADAARRRLAFLTEASVSAWNYSAATGLAGCAS